MPKEEKEDLQQMRMLPGRELVHSIYTKMSDSFLILQVLQTTEKLSPEGMQYVERLLRLTRRGLWDTFQLSDILTKGDRFDLPHPVYCNVSLFLRNVQKNLTEVLFGDTDVRLSFSSREAEDVYAEIDPPRIERVLFHLVRNSLQHRGAQPQIILSLKRKEDQIYISVQDNGSGIPDEKLPTLFETYKQVVWDTLTPAARLGLGLPLSRLIARSMDGDLIYEPVKQGAKFTIILPYRGRARVREADFVYIPDREETALFFAEFLVRENLKKTYPEQRL